MIRELIIDHLWRWHLLLPSMLGLALVLAGLLPRQQLRGLERLRAAPLACLLRGLPALLLPALLLWLLHADIMLGRGACLFIILVLAATGMGLLGRHLGEQLHPDGVPWQQLALGATALALAAIPPALGIPLALLLASLGLGALYGKRS